MTFIVIIFLTLAFSALFSGLEMAFLSANKMHIELQRKKGVFPYGQLSHLVKNPARFIATVLVGNNIALVVYGHYMHLQLGSAPWSGGSEYAVLLIETAISTIILLFLGEYIPKALFRAHADQLLRIFSIPAYIIYILLYIPVSLFTGISSLVIRFIFRKELPGYTPVFGRVELDNYVRERMADQREDAEEVDHELEIFKNALEFSARKAREFMIPRTEIVALEVGSTIDEMRSLLIETGYSKALVYQDSIDKIIGYAHAFELFRMPTDVRSILRPVSYIPESMRANEILDSFTREKRSMAIVIDEFGGTSGMITLEDVVEEIFGEIEDEHDTDEFIERKLSDTDYIFSSRLEIDYLNDEYNLGLPESENYTTLGGLIFDFHESIPEKNEVIQVGDFTMTIREVSDNRIEEVLLKINEPS